MNSGAGANIGMPQVNFVPVTILDDQDGPWDKSAWKTEALYGNPLAGFTWPPQYKASVRRLLVCVVVIVPLFRRKLSVL